MEHRGTKFRSEAVSLFAGQKRRMERTAWVVACADIGGFVCSLWIVGFLLFHREFLAAFLWWGAAGYVYFHYGMPLLFVGASLALSLIYHQVGIWLPITAGVLGALTLWTDILTLQSERKWEEMKGHPENAGQEDVIEWLERTRS